MDIGDTVRTAWRHFTGHQKDIETVVERFEADDRLEMRDDSPVDPDGTVEEKVAEGTENGATMWRGNLKYRLEDSDSPARIELRWPKSYGDRVEGIGVSVEAGFEPYDIFTQEEGLLYEDVTQAVVDGFDDDLIETRIPDGEWADERRSQDDYSPNLHQIAAASLPVGADQELIDTVRDRFVTLIAAYEEPEQYR